jgi:Tol biopolymer transport system component
VPAVAHRGLRWRFAAGALLALALGAGIFFLGRISVWRSEPAFQRLTFRRGSIVTARFAPDNQTVVYDAAWEGEPPDIFAVRIESPESRALGFPGATLHGISRSGELALGLKQTSGFSGFAFPGVLAWAPFSGGAPRAVAERVTAADWSADGSQMALVRDLRGNFRLEYPSGTVLYQTAGYIDRARISPSGDHVAFLDHPATNDDAGYVAVVDRSGHYKTLTTTFSSIEGLAWSSKGDEIWFSGAQAGSRADLWAVTLSGRRRLILRQSATVRLHDIGADGRVLIANEELRSTMMFHGPSDNRERELTWLDWSLATDISPDGSMIVFSESGEGAREGETQYLRETNGAPAVKLGRGSFGKFSTDGKFVVSTDNGKGEIAIYPTGPGEVRHVRPKGFTVEQAGMLADGQRLWFQGHESASRAGIYVSNLDGTSSRLVVPGGVAMQPCLTPDGRYLIARVGGDAVLVPVDGDKPRPLPTTIEEDERIACWARDGRSFLIHRRTESPAKLYRVDVATGRRDFVREIGSADRAGLGQGLALIMTPDAKSYVYNAQRTLDELYIVNGLK